MNVATTSSPDDAIANEIRRLADALNLAIESAADRGLRTFVAIDEMRTLRAGVSQTPVISITVYKQL